ncbi:hypothetical protein MMC27_008453 [Xylographa pallens]|nr:hypothetical protein [Xylographa pallens]
MSTPLLPINTERDTSRLHWNLDVDPSPQSPTNPPWLDFHIDPIEFYFGTASASDAVSTAGALNQSFSVPDGFTTSEDDQNITWNSLGLTSASKTIPYSSGLASGEWDIATGPSISQNAGPLPRDTYDSTNHGSEAEARLFDSLAALDESLLRTAGRGRKRIPLSASDSPARLSMYVPSTASTTETRASNPESIRRSVSSSSSISAMSTLYSLRSSALQPILPIIRGYPKLLLEEDYKSPFIHRKLYRSANHDMTLMAKSNMAICCASALGNVDSAPYIVKAISAERERLIRESHKYSCMEEWDALHAMCVYQIIELLCVEEEDDEMPNLTTAQLHIPFLLKMTRRFAQNHTGDKDFSNTDESDWTEWLVAETVRRTIFLVNIINILASHVNLAASHYFEPLDDTLILDMTLPAPDALWQARTADSWRAAREQLAREGAQEQTLRAILSGAEGRPIDEPEPGSLGLSSSASLANLIIMCAIATTQHHKLIA